MRAFQTAFRTKMAECHSFNIGSAMTHPDALYLFNKNLPAAWKQVLLSAQGSRHNFAEALKFYVNQAKADALLHGTLKRAAAAAPDQVHALNSTINQSGNTPAIDDTREVCRDHAAGRCNRRRCAYRHPSRPGGRNTDDRPKCDHCGKLGHLAIKCFRRIREEKEKKQKQDSTNVTTGCSKCDCKQSPDDDYIDDGAEFAIDDATYVTMTSEVALAVAALKPKGYSPGSPSKGIVMILDGASTCVIVQTEKGCYNVRNTNRKVRVGGKDGKNILQATKEARFRFYHLVDGVRTVTDLPALIVPGFGCNIMPE